MIKAGSLFIPEGDKFFQKKFEQTGNRFDYSSLSAAVTHARKGVAVDVGAHVGSWSVHMARWFREVIAFEPHDENYRCLVENVKHLPNVLCCNAACGSVKATASIKKHGTNSGCMTLVGGNDFQVIRLDDFGLMELDFLKIDVEGFEGHVIRGALEVIGNFRPVIVYENNGLGPKLMKGEWINPEPIMKSLGYKMIKKVQHDEIWKCG